MNLTVDEFVRWSLETFIGATAEVSIKKLRGEVEELEAALAKGFPIGRDSRAARDVVAAEYADCLMCLFDSAARAGFNPDEVSWAFSKKLVENKNRQWRRNEDGTYSHYKDEHFEFGRSKAFFDRVRELKAMGVQVWPVLSQHEYSPGFWIEFKRPERMAAEDEALTPDRIDAMEAQFATGNPKWL